MSDNRSDRSNRSTARGGVRTGTPAPYRRSPQQSPQGGHIRPVWFVVVMDVLLLGVALNVFALFHHIIPQDSGTQGVDLPGISVTAPATPGPSPSPTETQPETMAPTGSATQSTEITATPTPQETQAATADQGMWGAKFADKFTDGTVEKTDMSYKSKDINVTVTKNHENGVTFFVTDVYVRNKENLMSGLANGKYGVGQRETVKAQANRFNAVYAINGDNYGGRYDGVVIRNGTLYREKVYKDVLVMYNDGSMKAFTKKAFKIDDIKQSGAWQAWNFGPVLLDAEGQPLTTFDAADIGGANPRSAIGYYEPGHYCFVLVDGRSAESSGVKLPALAQIMSTLGCKVAYNLDGGRTSVMAFMGAVANDPYEGGRSISDIIYIGEIQ